LVGLAVKSLSGTVCPDEQIRGIIMKRFSTLFTASLITLGLHCTSAFAGGEPKVISPIEAHLLADRIAAQSLAAKDPLAMIMAARLKLQNPDREVVRQPIGSLASTPAATPARPHPRSAEALLARASALARERPDLLALIEDVRKDRARGVPDGPITSFQEVTSGHEDKFNNTFKGGETATVLITGNGDSNLDLYVFDDKGQRVCASERLDDIEVCRWQPGQSGNFRIHVMNRGPASNEYVLRSN
jgi:hypothetical protein